MTWLAISNNSNVQGVPRHGTKWIRKASSRPKMTNFAYFGPNSAVFEPKILILTGGSKSFGIHITENHLGIGKFGKNADFGPNLAAFARSWPEHGFALEVNSCYWSPKFRILGRKSIFCFWAPDFVNEQFVALGKTVHFAPSDWFFDFSCWNMLRIGWIILILELRVSATPGNVLKMSGRAN